MSNLVSFAQSELERAGLFSKDSDYGGMMGEAVLKMVRLFAEEGHSGMSASMAVSIFEKVARFEPLTPLTGEDDEWMECGDGVFQNRRCSHIFKENGKAYDMQGRVFRYPDGGRFIGAGSLVPVEFPHVPQEPIVVDVDHRGESAERTAAIQQNACDFVSSHQERK